MENLFAYGTLMCDDIMLEVSGHSLASRPALLKDYRRYSVKTENFPGIIPFPDGEVDGVAYLGVSDSAWNRLDKFEGEMYVRERVRVQLNSGEFLRANVYVVAPDFYNILENIEWSFSEFLKNGKTDFKKRYKGFSSNLPAV